MQNSFSKSIMELRYSWEKETGEKETWEEIAKRVASNVLTSVTLDQGTRGEIYDIIAQRKFIPGGRFLAQAGRSYHQVNNCLSGETKFITRSGLKTLKESLGEVTLLSTGGEWVKATVQSFGVQELYELELVKSGETKSIFTTLGHRWFVSKAVGENGRSLAKVEKLTSELVAGDKLYQIFGYGISRTSPSLAGIQHGLVFGDGTRESLESDPQGFATASINLCGDKNKFLLEYFPGYSSHENNEGIRVSGLPRMYKEYPSLSSNDRGYLYGWLVGYFAADGCVDDSGNAILCSANLQNLNFVKDVCYILGIGTNAIHTQSRISNLTGESSTIYRLTFVRETLTESFLLMEHHKYRFSSNAVCSRQMWRVSAVKKANKFEEVFCAVVPETHEFVLEDNILTGNCFTLRAEDTRESWGDLMSKSTLALMSGGGIGVDYSRIRENGAKLKRSGGSSSGPIPLIRVVNEIGRGVMSGGKRRSAIWAGLNWQHPDIFDFITLKNWSEEVRKLKETDYDFPATADMTNISVILDKEFFFAYDNKEHAKHTLAQKIYWDTINRMVKTAEPGFSVDYNNSNESLRNACTEIVSDRDSDVCCLGSINLPQIKDLEELKKVTELAIIFLLAGTEYSDIPYEKVRETREDYRRLGLGLMGMHEWLIVHGYSYGENPEFELWLQTWKDTSESASKVWASKFNFNTPKATRAIAPNGSISIAGGLTTSGIEPIFSLAYQRRYLTPDGWKKQFVVDFVAEKLYEQGVDLDTVEDAYTLSLDVERRIKFQAFVQRFVDNAISSTINLPAYGTAGNDNPKEFGETLYKYLPQLRGITAYPDGSRGGQPLTPVDFNFAITKKGVVFEGNDECSGGVCGV